MELEMCWRSLLFYLGVQHETWEIQWRSSGLDNPSESLKYPAGDTWNVDEHGLDINWTGDQAVA